MRRELRRHPVQGKPTKNPGRGPRSPRAGGGGSRTGSGGGTRIMPGASGGDRTVRFLPGVLQPAWFREIWTELKKVQWPTRQETINLTIVVVVVAAILGVLMGGLDASFNWILERTLL